MYNNEYYGSTNDYRNYISHHGIKGQKWGVKHGPPYPLEKATSKGIIKRWGDYQKKVDKQREERVHKLAKKIYKKGPLKKLENYRHDQENKNIEKTYSWNKQQMITQQHIQNHQEMMRIHNDITQQHINQVHHTMSMMLGKDAPKEDRSEINTKEFLPLDYKSFKHDDPKNRQNLAAILGLKAINKSGIRDKADPSNKWDKEWFLYEDQTELMPEIADLINHGYTSKQIISSLDKTYNRVHQMNDKEYESITDKEWAISDVWSPEADTFKQYYPNATENAVSWREKNRKWMIDYIRACEDIYNEEHKK